MKRQKNLNKYVQKQFTCIKHMLLIVGWGQEPRRTRGERDTGDGGRKGRKWDIYNSRKWERNSKRQAFIICCCLHPIKEMNATFLDFHSTFSKTEN